MKVALEEAEIAFEKNEVPVGAVLVYKDQIISRAHNQVESLQDATAHAEMLCLRKAASKLGNWRLLDSTLYCTLQPCLMCAGAIILSRVGRLVWGAPDLRHGADLTHFLNHPIHKVDVCQEILGASASLLLKKFFQRCRHAKTL
ncbi:MAG TPA: nucleoside deaminase [Rhabdochlamydiaceae bacterium]|nr:nucleoside deaminase [Rhabdochlamydiaceae bacterium]